MIPINIENDGTVKKADLSSEWYSYENQRWANIALVSNDSKETYKNATAGTTISNTDILAYFVWIPRYKYKISTGGTTTTSLIDIVFENKNTPKSTGDAVNSYHSHPGFTFGSDELNGIWVGKFETTGEQNNPTVLPSLLSLRGTDLNSQFQTAKNLNNYGFNNSDAHMMKNSEWGTIAYLSHSEYGLKGEIRINNNQDYMTGCGANTHNSQGSTECQMAFGSDIEEYPQSSSGNITGVFDMAGSAGERVMGNYNNYLGSSGLSSMPDSKYYDKLTKANYDTGCNNGKCYGQALSETAHWYIDWYQDLSYTYPWFVRGGRYCNSSSTGAFGLQTSTGAGSHYITFRISIGVL